MKLWAVYCQDFGYQPVSADLVETAYGVTMKLTEGQLVTVDVERRQTGWSILGAAHPKCLVLAWSPTGDPAVVQILARGRIVDLPDDLLALSQTVTYECAPVDIDERLLAWARALPDAGAEIDPLFSDADPESVETYLLGRSATIAVHPATHEPHLVDDLLGATVHDLSAVARIVSSSRGTYDPPRRTYRAVLTSDWTQVAEGNVDIASRIPRISTLDPGFSGRVEGALSTSGSEGWSTAGGVETAVRIGEEAGLGVGSTYKALTIKRDLMFIDNGADEQGNPGRYIDTRIYDANREPQSQLCSPVFARYDVKIRKFPLQYSYQQARRDIAYLALDCASQQTSVLRDADEDAFEWSLGDIFLDGGLYPEWKPDTDYAKGAQVRFGDRYYEAVAAHRSSDYFDEDRGIVVKRQIYESAWVDLFFSTRTYWIRILPKNLPSKEAMTAFLSTPRGEQAVRHGMLRLRKEARRRLRAWNVSIEVPWAAGIGVGLEDSVRILVPWDTEGTVRAAVGKVVGIERRWPGKGAPVVAIDVGIPFGVGGVPQPAGVGYVESGYVSEGHFDGAAETEIEMDVSADPADVRVVAQRLRSPNYAVRSVRVVNTATDQIAETLPVVASGAEITEISVRKATSIRLQMRDLAATSEPLERELDVVGRLLVTPQGIQL